MMLPQTRESSRTRRLLSPLEINKVRCNFDPLAGFGLSNPLPSTARSHRTSSTTAVGKGEMVQVIQTSWNCNGSWDIIWAGCATIAPLRLLKLVGTERSHQLAVAQPHFNLALLIPLIKGWGAKSGEPQDYSRNIEGIYLTMSLYSYYIPAKFVGFPVWGPRSISLPAARSSGL